MVGCVRGEGGWCRKDGPSEQVRAETWQECSSSVLCWAIPAMIVFMSLFALPFIRKVKGLGKEKATFIMSPRNVRKLLLQWP